MSDGLSQSDLDALFAGVTFEEPDTSTKLEIKMEDGWEVSPVMEENQGEIMSQDDIDKLLAEFGS